MDTIICPKCKKNLASHFKTCPSCGTEQYNARTVDIGDVFAFLGFLVLIFMLYQSGWMSSGDSDPDEPYQMSAAERLEDDKDKAYIGAQTALKGVLRDPDSLQVIQYAVMEDKTDSNKLVVYLEYRSKNGFGGYVAGKAGFTCTRGGYSCVPYSDD